MRVPIRVLELRSVRGTGGGPEKTILLGAARSDPSRFQVTVCYVRDARDEIFGIGPRAASLKVDYVEVRERHSLDPAAWSRLRALVRDRRIDIVHAHEYKTDLIAAWLARTERVVALSTAHGWTGHSRRERWLYYPADRRLLARFPHVIAVSSDIRRALIAAGARPDRVTTILNGIDHRAFRRSHLAEPIARRALGLSADDVVIGSIGRLEPQKRFDLLIDAVAAVRTAHPRVRLVLAGDGSLRSALESQAQRVLGDDGCRLLGHRSDVADLHHAFDLFVQSSDYEGTPNAVLEAMALETALVATDAGGTAELAVDGVHGRIVPCGDAGALTRAIDAALDDRDGTARMTAAARSRVERELSFDARMRALECIYEQLADSRRDDDRVAPAAV